MLIMMEFDEYRTGLILLKLGKICQQSSV